jgi:tetratricopeptide (TPR) repeat protein
VAFLLASFFVMLAPTSSFIPVRDLAVEHRMYLPLAPVLALACVALWKLTHGCAQRLNRPAAASGVFAVLCVALAAGSAVATFRRAGVYSSDLAMWRDVVAKRPENARAHYNLGNALNRTQSPAEAIAHYERAVALDPADAYAQLRLGTTLRTLNRDDDALPHLQRACELSPNDAFILNEYGKALGRAKRFEEEEPLLRRAMQLQPEYWEPYLNLGSSLANQQRFDDAIPLLEQAASLLKDGRARDPALSAWYARAHLYLGRAQLERSRPANALPHLRIAVAHPTTQAETVYHLGRAYVLVDDYAHAAPWLEQAVQVNPGNIDARFHFGSALARLGRYEQAVEQLRVIEERNPSYPGLQDELQRIMRELTSP